MGVADKVCVVTGASSGIGRQTAVDLARAGARVCVAARREERMKELVADMGGVAAGHSYMVTDVSDRDSVRALAGHVRNSYGRCDVLVNNAGVGAERPFTPDRGIEDVHQVMAVNFFGAVYCTGELLPLLLESAPSSVVNVSSMAGRIAAPGVSAYSASKFALSGWSESLHYELADVGVCVSTVEPGFIPTEGFPQSELADDRVLRYALGSVGDVSRAIRDAIEGRKVQRVVPRWYYALQVPRLLVPPVFRFGLTRMAAQRQRRA
jgi:NAD(P)-dependent dehydrogenase (short-subunit alcohol dehydrogenase family)